MRRVSKRQFGQVGVVGTLAVLAFAAMTSVGAAVSPASTPAASSQYEKKQTICHRTGSKKNPYHTIRVSRRAVPAHLRHGDALGPCPSAVFTVCHKAKNGKTKTMKVRGAKAHRRHLKHGDKVKKCKAKKSAKPDKGKGKGKEKEKGKGKGKPKPKK